MGGLGSGRRYTSSERRPIIEDCPSLDLRILKNDIMPGNTIALSQKRANRETFKVVVYTEPDGLLMHYRFKGKIRTSKLLITHMPCNLGGYRSYLLCPECNTKRSIIYLDNHGRWGCRACFGLAYRSQRMNERQRHFYMAQKIRSQKLKSNLISKRPYRMKSQKHLEIVRKITWHQNKACQSFRKWFNDILKKYN